MLKPNHGWVNNIDTAVNIIKCNTCGVEMLKSSPDTQFCCSHDWFKVRWTLEPVVSSLQLSHAWKTPTTVYAWVHISSPEVSHTISSACGLVTRDENLKMCTSIKICRKRKCKGKRRSAHFISLRGKKNLNEDFKWSDLSSNRLSKLRNVFAFTKATVWYYM